MHHKAIFAANEVVNFCFPPFEKIFNGPPELIYGCYLALNHACQFYIVFHAGNFIANNPDGSFCLVQVRSAKEDQSIIENVAAIVDLVSLNYRSGCFGFYTANKMLALCL